jgi:2-polyprenyl-3-methyl-5-hydroxy-6-metoxy-1,4-benzoquinol methylase
MKKFNPSYTGPRSDILKSIPYESRKILDIGCSTGELGNRLKQQRDAHVTGIELSADLASEAQTKLDRVIIDDIEKISLNDYFPPKYFDCIIFGDVLEHLRDPWTVLRNATHVLRDDGVVVASIPNIRHYTTVMNLILKAYWPYRDRGIHDKNHLRFFTCRNIKELFGESDLQITKIHRNYRIIESPHPYNKYSRYFAFPLIKDFLTFQYIILAEKRPSYKEI